MPSLTGTLVSVAAVAEAPDHAAELAAVRRRLGRAEREREDALSKLRVWETDAVRRAASLTFAVDDLTSGETFDDLARELAAAGPAAAAREMQRLRREAARYRSALRALSGEADEL